MRGTTFDPLVAYNERVKLFAGFMNAMAVGMIGLAILGPLTQDLANARSSTFWWGVAGLVLHALAHYVLGYVRKEEPKE